MNISLLRSTPIILLRIGAALLFAVAPLISVMADAYAQDAIPDSTELASALDVRAAEGSVRVRWQSALASEDAQNSLPDLPNVIYGAHVLPMETFVVEAANTAPPVVVEQIETVEWRGPLPAAENLQPPALDWQPQSALLPVSDDTLPSAPLFLLREGYQRGRFLAIYAFSPIFQEAPDGPVRRVVAFEAAIAASQPVQPEEVPFTGQVVANESLAAAPGPTNPFVNRLALKIVVTEAGIQRILPDGLALAGLRNTDVTHLRLFAGMTQIPLHVIDTDGDNRVASAGDELRFFAPKPGDRWNAQDTYWLVGGSQVGLKMDSRDAMPGSAPLSGSAFAEGVWYAPLLYEPNYAGPDGDYYFHLKAVTKAGSTQSGDTLTAALDVPLPIAADGAGTEVHIQATVLDVRERDGGAPLDPPEIPHRLRVRSGASTVEDDGDDWVVDFGDGPAQNVTRTFSPAEPSREVFVSLLPGPYATSVLVDSVAWRVPVNLSFGGKGAFFTGLDGVRRYRLTQTPTGRTLYDVTDALRPVLLTVPDGAAFQFQDGPDARKYVLSGPGTLHTPEVLAHRPVRFSADDGADVVYIAPREFHAALQPLLDHRAAEGYAARAVDLQHIYDAWSFGQVDARAIRAFLRYAVANWSPAPVAAVLVGDGTWDPLHFEPQFNSLNVVPPYMAEVDPWWGETACENCFGQLDGDDPLTESAFLPDIWIGRFPVQTTGEVTTVVNKIIGYETSIDLPASWRGDVIQLADNFIHADGRKDAAGNFPRFVESIIAEQPATLRFLRNYYNAPINYATLDPATAEFMRSIAPWIETDPAVAFQRTIDLLRGGAGIVTYTGHAQHWQWATTDPSHPEGRILGLWDVLQLDNGDRLFVALAMTCLTSQFTRPANFHMTLDEHLFLREGGGAIAVWGPAGLSVAHGHDALQRGFYKTLWSKPPMRARLGELVQGGYVYVATKTNCCQDVIRTFLLLGDPLTPALVQPTTMLTLPKVGNR